MVQGVWQVLSHAHGHSYVYSAFYDDRPGVGFLPVVRLIVLASFVDDKQLSALYCHVWYKGFNEPYVVLALTEETGNLRSAFAGHNFWSFTYTCPLAFPQPVPTHVSLTQDRCGKSRVISTFEPIQYTPYQEPPIEFGVCVTSGFGNYPTHEVVEWIELQTLYGVAEFNLYDVNYHANVSAVFNYYTRKGVLRVFNLPHPLEMKTFDYEKVRNLWTVPLDDCMLRNMYRYRYMVILDLDEVIVPRHQEHYSLMLRRIDQRLNLTRPFHSYSFHNAYFFHEFAPTDANETLRSLRMRARVNVSGDFFVIKSFVNPLSCFNLFQHLCRKTLAGYEFKTFHVPNDIAIKHHYRACPDGFLNCKEMFKQKTQDDVMLKIKPRLLAAVEPVLRELRVGQ